MSYKIDKVTPRPWYSLPAGWDDIQYAKHCVNQHEKMMKALEAAEQSLTIFDSCISDDSDGITRGYYTVVETEAILAGLEATRAALAAAKGEK